MFEMYRGQLVRAGGSRVTRRGDCSDDVLVGEKDMGVIERVEGTDLSCETASGVF